MKNTSSQTAGQHPRKLVDSISFWLRIVFRVIPYVCRLFIRSLVAVPVFFFWVFVYALSTSQLKEADLLQAFYLFCTSFALQFLFGFAFFYFLLDGLFYGYKDIGRRKG